MATPQTTSQTPKVPRTGKSQDMQECVESCVECQQACYELVSYCLQKGGKHAEASHIRLLIDCAEICQTSANFMIRDSELCPRICKFCAEACIACAESCEEFSGDQALEDCAKLCRHCANLCQQIA